ncbi:phosphonate metabolism transcriptional regulator PhnF [Aestuariirhabdus sp. Z084]|uniref:phosphonate metabolism transcriptional regulator PhnF n=1 Tax=Aestuariirhabdus haliotis TaxID=2918751 RepID=UPI00201B40D4|nr:phosphonate metabolism transcriptional regulator PhnF [Aestuariirhabdus haliotis]MCL6416008.1 phosphonate metabolism transcriptional regulator PhnF [Aestuariirhabdus haliotis]MCL6419959.1 phosphonate metabolism transcriptional regulator PhnF [Aestuariirhabdus haliotis]
MALYRKIAFQLRDEIFSQYNAGELLPPEGRLADRFQVNRHTVRRAIDELVHDGIVRRYQGLGCRVVQTPIDYALHDKAAFSHNLNCIGLDLETEVLDCGVTAIPEPLASQLDVSATAPVFQLHTRRLIEGEPVCLIRHYLFGLSAQKLERFSGGSLHEFLRQQFHLELRRGTTRLRARMPTLEECTQLMIGRGVPVMEVHTQNRCRQSADLREYSIARSRSDLFEYSVEPKHE